MTTTTVHSSAAPSMAAATTSGQTIRVWDVPTRVFHWTLAVSFAGAFLTAESEHWRLVHAMFGYTMLGLLAFRVVWGLFGTRHARFASFVQGPAAVLRYLRSLFHEPEHHVGHNPAGALAVLALLLLVAVAGVSGLLTWQDIGGDFVEELHEGAANTLLAVVLVHLAGVLASSLLHRENLVRAMFNGQKVGRPADGISRRHRWLGVLLLVSVLGFWAGYLADAPSGRPVASQIDKHDRD